uniref:Uncharacterized protein n=1 Tax=Anopheles dirus TaxID=7168 RepID=A0A182NW95_9DIPT
MCRCVRVCVCYDNRIFRKELPYIDDWLLHEPKHAVSCFAFSSKQPWLHPNAGRCVCGSVECPSVSAF